MRSILSGGHDLLHGRAVGCTLSTVALVEAAHLPPNHGLEQAKTYAACRRLNVAVAIASNGHLFIEFDRSTALRTSRQPSSAARSAGSFERGLAKALDL